MVTLNTNIFLNANKKEDKAVDVNLLASQSFNSNLAFA
ncbi:HYPOTHETICAL PROTEIN MCJ_004320 [Mesomycoplasma conjunctivae]|uniref:Uncharacterized protein n=2 Tax=Mesomycoplasma conjunctivae TaxID=45361 RepID=C5J6M5_MESCH|nr:HYPOTHETICAL PROTEIN MCJ_004320 [Mesomycoplasma conjunctivae]